MHIIIIIYLFNSFARYARCVVADGNFLRCVGIRGKIMMSDNSMAGMDGHINNSGYDLTRRAHTFARTALPETRWRCNAMRSVVVVIVFCINATGVWMSMSQ